MTILRRLLRVAAAAFALVALAPMASAEDVTPQAVTVPQSLTFTYTLAAGARSAPIRVPPNTPIQVIGTCLTLNFRGVGQVALLSIPGAGGFLEWVGLDSTAGARITQGYSGVAGTKIVFLDYAHKVSIEVASPISIRVFNDASAARVGTVTLTW